MHDGGEGEGIAQDNRHNPNTRLTETFKNIYVMIN